MSEDILSLLEGLVAEDRKLVVDTAGLLKRYYLSSAHRQSLIHFLASIDGIEGDTVTQKILRMVKPGPPQPPPTSPPTAPVIGNPTVVGSTVTVPVTTQGSSVLGVQKNEIWLGSSSGAEAYREQITAGPWSAALPDGTYWVKFKALDPTATGTPATTGVSGFSNEKSFTITSAPVLGPDTKAPTQPGQPNIVSGGGATLATVVSATPTADTDGTPFNQVTTGAKTARWYLAGVAQAGKDCTLPSLGSETLYQIGASIATPGTDSGTVLVGPLLTSNNIDAHWSNKDGGLSYKAAQFSGHLTETIKITDADGGPVGGAAGLTNYYNKPVVWGFRADLSDTAAYIDFIVFNKNGANTATIEGRPTPNVGAQQLVTPFAFTLPFYVEKDINLYTKTVTFWTSPDAVTWTQRYTGGIDLGQVALSGRGAAGNMTPMSGGYSNVTKTLDPLVYIAFTGTQQVGSPTTIPVQVTVLDGASPPNESTKSLARDCVYDAQSNGGGGTSGQSWGADYIIGGNGMNHNTPRAIRLYAQSHRTVLSAINNWEATFGTTMAAVFAAVQAKNPQWEGSQYLDSTRTQSINFLNAVLNFQTTQPYGSGWCLLNGDGTLAKWDDNFGNDVVCNMAATAQDFAGRTVQYFDPLYRDDAFVGGGAAGLSSIGMSPNVYCRSTYWDDFFGAPWILGLFTVGNVNAAATMRAGYKTMFTNWRALQAARGKVGIVAANISQCLQNMPADAIADYAGTIDLGLQENVGSALGANWLGGSGLIAMQRNNQHSVITSTGFPIFQYLCSPTADSAELQRRRTATAFCRIFGNGLINLQYDPVTYWVAADQLPVRMSYFDVNLVTGAGNPDPYGTDYKILAWTGDPVSGAAGAVQTESTPYSGSYYFRREMTNAVFIAVATEAPGTQYATFPFSIQLPTCPDDPFFNGATYTAGTPVPCNPGTGFVARKV